MKTITSSNNETPEINPLTSFFRKKKLSLFLPSKGQWYPENSLSLDKDGSLSVFAMTADADIKFRAGDISLSGKSTYDLIKECLPGILNPENIPNIDVDTILLAIRLASYGDDFELNVSVPNTKLVRTLKISLTTFLCELLSRKDKWDDSIIIESEDGQKISLTIYPISLKYLFNISKDISQQKKALTKNFDSNENIKDEKLFTDSINQLSNTAINLVCDSIKTLELIDSNNNTIVSLTSSTPQDEKQINQIIRGMDIEFFNAIRDHLEAQRKKYAFSIPLQHSTLDELKAGAPPEWQAEITFMGSSFLPEQNAKQNII